MDRNDIIYYGLAFEKFDVLDFTEDFLTATMNRRIIAVFSM